MLIFDILKEITDAGHDITALRYYGIAATAVLFYDYLLTLGDEIKYAWHGKKSWVFGIFLVNRYLPIAYRFWSLYMYHSTNGCDKTVFFEILAFVGITLLAQVVITLRIYAVTNKNRTITLCLGAMTTSQFILGLYLIAYVATNGAQPILRIPLPVYMICIVSRHRALEIGFTTMSLVYDFLAFSAIVYLVARSSIEKVQVPRLLRTIAQGGTYYFLIIFSSHLALELTLLFARPTLQLVPATAITVYLPVMITRLLLSLKEANASQEQVWGLREPGVHTTRGFVESRCGATTASDEICLDTLASTHEGTQSSNVTV